MPKFADEEREEIQRLLLTEGERLFSIHGMKKITIDDITQAVNISKGSFYNFYSNKEHLYVVIVFRKQKEIFSEINEVLLKEKMQPKELVRKVMLLLVEMIDRCPILKNVNIATFAHVRRRLPDHIFTEHTQDDIAFFRSLSQYGVTFCKPVEIITKSLQAIYGLTREYVNDEDYKELVAIFVDGIVAQVKE